MAQLSQGQSFLKNNGPAKLLQSFFNRLPDHQIDMERCSTCPTDLEMEVNHFSRVLQTCLMDITSNQTLLLDFNCGVEGVSTINLTKDEVEVHYLPHKSNIAEDLEDDMEMLAAVPGPQLTMLGHPRLQLLLQTSNSSLSQPNGRLEALMSKENGTLTLMQVGMEEAWTCFDVHASQDEASYDGNVSDAEEDNIEVVPDEVDDTQVESSKPVGAVSTADEEDQKTTNNSSGSQTLKSADKNPTNQPSNKALSGTRDGPVYTIKASSLRDARTNIWKTTFWCTVPSGQWTVSICYLRSKRCQTYSSMWM